MRKKNSLKNFLTDVIPYIIFALLGFLQVKLFIKNLGEEIYSLNQLFLQIFSYISLVEGGVGAIICQKYYKLFVNNDEKGITKVFISSKKSMFKVSLYIALIGMIVSLFLNYMTNNSLSFYYMQGVFLLYVLRSIIEYLNLSPRFVIQSNQKLYKINLILNFYKFLEVVITIVLLIYKTDYFIILITSIFIRLIMYYFANKKIYKEYPYLKNKINDKPEKIKGIGYMYYHKIAGAVYNNIDILLISSKLSSFNVTVYSSYNYICRYINDIVYMFGNSIMASLGNVLYGESKEKSYDIFEELNSFFMFIASFCSICFYLLINNFIKLWIGIEYSLNKWMPLLMATFLFLTITKRIMALLCETKGMYKETKNIVGIEAVINVVLSILLLNVFGMNGVIIATNISCLLTTFWYYPIFIYKNIFNKNTLIYFKKYVFTLLCTLIIGYLLKHLKIFIVNDFFDWIVLALINSLITGILLLIIFLIFMPSFKRIIKKVFLTIRK